MPDKAFLAHCVCDGDSCSCTSSDNTIRFDFSHLSAMQCAALADDIESLPPAMQASIIKQLTATKGNTSMSLEKLSTAEIASVKARASKMTNAELDDLISTLTAAKDNESVKAAAAEGRLFMTATKNHATRASHYSRNVMSSIDGGLKRAGLPPFDELATKPASEIKQILASENQKMKDNKSAMTREQLDKTKMLLVQVGAFA
jgi:hypothetical protein